MLLHLYFITQQVFGIMGSSQHMDVAIKQLPENTASWQLYATFAHELSIMKTLSHPGHQNVHGHMHILYSLLFLISILLRSFDFMDKSALLASFRLLWVRCSLSLYAIGFVFDNFLLL